MGVCLKAAGVSNKSCKTVSKQFWNCFVSVSFRCAAGFMLCIEGSVRSHQTAVSQSCQNTKKFYNKEKISASESSSFWMSPIKQFYWSHLIEQQFMIRIFSKLFCRLSTGRLGETSLPTKFSPFSFSTTTNTWQISEFIKSNISWKMYKQYIAFQMMRCSVYICKSVFLRQSKLNRFGLNLRERLSCTSHAIQVLCVAVNGDLCQIWFAGYSCNGFGLEMHNSLSYCFHVLS